MRAGAAVLQVEDPRDALTEIGQATSNQFPGRLQSGGASASRRMDSVTALRLAAMSPAQVLLEVVCEFHFPFPAVWAWDRE